MAGGTELFSPEAHTRLLRTKSDKNLQHETLIERTPPPENPLGCNGFWGKAKTPEKNISRLYPIEKQPFSPQKDTNIE